MVPAATKLKARRSDMDKYNHIGYSTFLNWYELGHLSFLYSIGLSFQKMEEKYNVKTFVRHAEIDYLSQVFAGDTITVYTVVSKVGKTSMTYVQRIAKGDNIVSEAKMVVVFVDENGVPTRIPDDIRVKVS